MSEVICNNGHVMNPGDEACRRCKSKPMDSENKEVPQEETSTPAPESESPTPAEESVPGNVPVGAEPAPEATPDAEGAAEGPEVTD